MTHLEFLRSEKVTRMLERAAAGAGVPLSIHFVQRNQEGLRICGWGQCAACRAIAEAPGGASACRLSRSTASTMAIRQQRPIAYVCHLGFACVAVTPFAKEGYVITLGPYCPMEEQRSLQEDVAAGFAAFHEGQGEEVPFSLDDIHRAPAASVPTIAGWLQESLHAAWANSAEAVENTSDNEGKLATKIHHREASVPRDSLDNLGQEIASALASESFARARALIQTHLEERQRGTRFSIERRRARVAALTSATLEALERTGLALGPGWTAYAEFVRSLSELGTDSELLDRSLAVFSFVRRNKVREERSVALPHYPELFQIVKAHVLEGVTLEFVARELNETPSAISHRLKRKFDMSFSDYVARIRIDAAKELLRHTALGVTEVGHRVGIADQSNFAKLFKKIEGIPPSSYRKAHGKGL